MAHEEKVTPMQREKVERHLNKCMQQETSKTKSRRISDMDIGYTAQMMKNKIVRILSCLARYSR